MSMRHCAAVSVIFLATVTARASAGPEEVQPGGIDTRALVEIRWLSELPQALAVALGRNKTGPESFADLQEPFNSTDAVGSRLPLRRFLIAGLSAKGAIVAYEQGGDDRARRYRARTYVLEGSTWQQTGEWPLIRHPNTLRDVIFEVKYIPYGSKMVRLEQRIWKTRPARRDSPLRETNITDDEVREIQAAAHGVVPDSLVNISGVVSGCPCEEGPACTDQVWIVAYRPGLMKGLQLSRINHRWTIGVVQQWWLEFETVDDRKHYASWTDWLDAREEFYQKFPACTSVSRADAPSAVQSPCSMSSQKTTHRFGPKSVAGPAHPPELSLRVLPCPRALHNDLRPGRVAPD